MEFQLSYFKSLKMILLTCCTHSTSKFGKLSSGHRTGKYQFSFKPQRKAMLKECSNYYTVALTSHARKIMLKILQVRLQQYVNWELPDVQAGFRKGRGPRDQYFNIYWIIENTRELKKKKKVYFCFTDYTKALTHKLDSKVSAEISTTLDMQMIPL